MVFTGSFIQKSFCPQDGLAVAIAVVAAVPTIFAARLDSRFNDTNILLKYPIQGRSTGHKAIVICSGNTSDCGSQNCSRLYMVVAKGRLGKLPETIPL